jgi:hypothetical protein
MRVSLTGLPAAAFSFFEVVLAGERHAVCDAPSMDISSVLMAAQVVADVHAHQLMAICCRT